jgi:hypothetical protein
VTLKIPKKWRSIGFAASAFDRIEPRPNDWLLQLLGYPLGDGVAALIESRSASPNRNRRWRRKLATQATTYLGVGAG